MFKYENCDEYVKKFSKKIKETLETWEPAHDKPEYQDAVVRRVM